MHSLMLGLALIVKYYGEVNSRTHVTNRCERFDALRARTTRMLEKAVGHDIYNFERFILDSTTTRMEK